MSEPEFTTLEALIGNLVQADEELHEKAHREEKKRAAALRKARGDGLTASELDADIAKRLLAEADAEAPASAYAEEVEAKRQATIAAKIGKVPPPPSSRSK